MHIHSFSWRYRFRYRPDFDVFSFIELAAAQGFTGVNISANGPGYRDLGGTDPAHFAAVREKLVASGLKCEIDTSDTRPDNLRQMLAVTGAVGGDTLRVYTKYQGEVVQLIEWTIRDLAAVAPLAADLNVVIVLENHEDFQGTAIATILENVNHPNVRALYDYGNSQMVGEDPLTALLAMNPYVHSVHIKDHLVVGYENKLWVQGVPIGQGNLPIRRQTELLYEGGLRRFCFENVWGYVAPVLVEETALPNTTPFTLAQDFPFLNSDQLPPADALSGEWVAFENGWEWLKTKLDESGFIVESER